MSKVQSRRTISYSRALFERAKERAAQMRVPLSALSEYAMERLLADDTARAADVIAASVERGVYVRANAEPKPRKLTTGDGFVWRGRVRGDASPKRAPGTARQAAEWLLEHGGDIGGAAERFGCSRRAVKQAVLLARVAKAKRESALEIP